MADSLRRKEYSFDMKTVVVFFDKPGYDEYPFDHEEYVIAYHDLAPMIVARGARFAIVRDQKTYKGNNVFAGYWLFENGTFVRHDDDVEADLIYDKGHFVPDESARMSNDRELTDICTDKFRTVREFPSLNPKTFLVHNKEELHQSLADIPTDAFVVAKPVDLEEGIGVIIANPAKVEEAVTKFPYLVQEFIDTSGGIPGIVDGMHDLRMVVIEGDIVVSYIRTPPPGKMTANVSQGGQEIEVLPEQLPAEAKAIVEEVDKVFSKFARRAYSVDVGRNKDGSWKIIELNAKTGLSPASKGKHYERFLNRLADVLAS